MARQVKGRVDEEEKAGIATDRLERGGAAMLVRGVGDLRGWIHACVRAKKRAFVLAHDMTIARCNIHSRLVLLLLLLPRSCMA